MKRLLKEPLLHFLVLGAALFVAYSLVSQRTGAAPGKIVISQGQITSMIESFARTWQRPPTSAELDGLVRERIRDEVFVREAMAMGLDKDDTVIRRRLRQKMEFVSDDIASQAEPTDAELNAYLQANPGLFRVDQRVSFRQVYLDPQKHGERLAADAAALLAKLNQADGQVDAATLGESTLLDHEFTRQAARDIARQFGDEFAAKLSQFPSGQWVGPVESGYGMHLVFISERTAGRAPALAEVREEVRREWANARRVETNDRFFQELLSRYTVTVEDPRQPSNALAANSSQ